MSFVYPRSNNVKEFAIIRSEMPVHSRINWNLKLLGFEDWGNWSTRRKTSRRAVRESNPLGTSEGGQLSSHHCAIPAPQSYTGPTLTSCLGSSINMSSSSVISFPLSFKGTTSTYREHTHMQVETLYNLIAIMSDNESVR